MGALMFALAVYAQSGTVSGSPNPCTIAGGQTVCTTTISWFSQGSSQVQVWISLNGAPESEFALTSAGGPYSQAASWIQGPPNSYVFNLYDYSSGIRGARLASTTVTGVYAITLTFTNQTRPSLASNFVVGDYFVVSVSGAPSNALVQIQWTNNTGGSSSTYTGGSTDMGGNFNSSPLAVVSGSIGRWTGQGMVGGVAVGSEFHTEVIAVPTGLKPGSIFPDGISCPPTNYQPYGFGVENLNWGITGLGAC
jgi:hypothetical protein